MIFYLNLKNIISYSNSQIFNEINPRFTENEVEILSENKFKKPYNYKAMLTSIKETDPIDDKIKQSVSLIINFSEKTLNFLSVKKELKKQIPYDE